MLIDFFHNLTFTMTLSWSYYYYYYYYYYLQLGPNPSIPLLMTGLPTLHSDIGLKIFS